MKVLVSVLIAVGLSSVGYLSAMQGGEKFDVLKVVRTVVIGFALGVTAAMSDFSLTSANWEVYVAANAGVIAFLDKIIKIVVEAVKG